MEKKGYWPNLECDTKGLALGHNMDHRGALALILIGKWGMVTGKDEGEDSAGRSKLTLMPPGEVVERAFDTAALAFEALEQRGWIKPYEKTAEEVHERIGQLRGTIEEAQHQLTLDRLDKKRQEIIRAKNEGGSAAA